MKHGSGVHVGGTVEPPVFELEVVVNGVVEGGVVGGGGLELDELDELDGVDVDVDVDVELLSQKVGLHVSEAVVIVGQSFD